MGLGRCSVGGRRVNWGFQDVILTQELVVGATLVFLLTNARTASTQRWYWQTRLSAVGIDGPALLMAQLEALAWIRHARDVPDPQVSADNPAVDWLRSEQLGCPGGCHWQVQTPGNKQHNE
jgi:hypothetical protein